MVTDGSPGFLLSSMSSRSVVRQGRLLRHRRSQLFEREQIS